MCSQVFVSTLDLGYEFSNQWKSPIGLNVSIFSDILENKNFMCTCSKCGKQQKLCHRSLERYVICMGFCFVLFFFWFFYSLYPVVVKEKNRIQKNGSSVCSSLVTLKLRELRGSWKKTQKTDSEP